LHVIITREYLPCHRDLALQVAEAVVARALAVVAEAVPVAVK